MIPKCSQGYVNSHSNSCLCSGRRNPIYIHPLERLFSLLQYSMGFIISKSQFSKHLKNHRFRKRQYCSMEILESLPLRGQNPRNFSRQVTQGNASNDSSGFSHAISCVKSDHEESNSSQRCTWVCRSDVNLSTAAAIPASGCTLHG